MVLFFEKINSWNNLLFKYTQLYLILVEVCFEEEENVFHWFGVSYHDDGIFLCKVFLVVYTVDSCSFFLKGGFTEMTRKIQGLQVKDIINQKTITFPFLVLLHCVTSLLSSCLAQLTSGHQSLLWKKKF